MDYLYANPLLGRQRDLSATSQSRQICFASFTFISPFLHAGFGESWHQPAPDPFDHRMYVYQSGYGNITKMTCSLYFVFSQQPKKIAKSGL